MLIHPQFDPIAVSVGPLAIRWYGLMYLAGFLAFLWLGKRRAQSQPWHGINAQDIDDLLFYGVLGVILGGRLGQVLFYEPGYYLSHPLEILAVWKGGMAFHGGMLGVFVAMALWARKSGKTFFQVTDFIAPLVPLGLMAGRIGNFINGELWGRVADPALPWAMVFPHVDPPAAPPVAAVSGGRRGLAAVRRCCGGSRRGAGRCGRSRGCSWSVTARCAFSPNIFASPTMASSACPTRSAWGSGSACRWCWPASGCC
jgi:phosphatidylglycerol:prolipoprotein diacylglycerol transferase